MQETQPLATRLLKALSEGQPLDALIAEAVDGPPPSLDTLKAELQTLIEGSPTPQEALTNEVLDKLREIRAHRPPPQARPFYHINEPEPEQILTAHGQKGPLLTAGMVGILAGAGGTGKSRLAAQMALTIADPSRDELEPTADGLWAPAQSGPVLLATYEDAPASTAHRLKRLAAHFDVHDAPVHILDLQGWPLFGPYEATPYAARPGRLPGFAILAAAAEAVKPCLIIIDPALSAYVGEQNAATPVREFVAALAQLARQHAAAVLLVAHSTKAGRADSDPFDAGQISGSAAWHDAARAALVLTRDRDGGRWTLAISKANYGPALLSAEFKDQWPAFRTGDSLSVWINRDSQTDDDAPKNKGEDFEPSKLI